MSPKLNICSYFKEKKKGRQYLKAIDDCYDDIAVNIWPRNYSKKWYTSYIQAVNKFRQPFIWKSHISCVF